MGFQDIIFGIIIPVILIIALSVTIGYLTNCQVNMIVGEDQYQQKAHEWLTWGVTIGWIVVVLIIVGLAISIKRRKFKDNNKLIMLIVLSFLVYGIIAAVAAVNIKKGADYEANKPYYTDCVWIASSILGTAGLLLIIWIVRKFKKTDAEKLADSIDETNQKKNEELSNQQEQIDALAKQNQELAKQNQQLNKVV